MGQSIQWELKGLDELKESLNKASFYAPQELEKALNKVSRKFRSNMKKRARSEYETAEHITSGFKMTQVKVQKGMLYSYFMPEARGNKGHAWHLQEKGYDLTRPTWWSKKKGVKYADGGKKIKFVPGRHLTAKELAVFGPVMNMAVESALDKILKEADCE